MNYLNVFKCLHFFRNIININYYVRYGLNAQIIPLDCNGFSFGKKTSRNGLYIAITCELIICNTCFRKSNEKLWTFTYPSGCKAQLDYILVNRKRRNSVKDCQAYQSFSIVYSYHKIVSTKLCLQFASQWEANCQT